MAPAPLASPSHTGRWALVLVGALLGVLAWGSLDLRPGPTVATGAPLAQATATSTPTVTLTPTVTPTPVPAFAELGGVALYAPHASGGGNALGIYCDNCTSATFTDYPTPPPYLTQVPQFTQVPYPTPLPTWTAQPVGYTTPVASAATVVVTPGTTPVVAANAARKYLRCTNDSDTAIYLSFAASQPVSTGMRVNATGGIFEMSGAQGSLYIGAVYAVATATGKTLMCVEGN